MRTGTFPRNTKQSCWPVPQFVTSFVLAPTSALDKKRGFGILTTSPAASPGQAKKWHRGQPLPHDLPYYDLPEEVLRELGRAPEGHKFVRVAADILLIAIGTGMVIDAIEDLSKI